MATFTWTQAGVTNLDSSGLSVSLSRNAVVRGTFDATSKAAVSFIIATFRTATTAETNGVDILIRRWTGLSGAGQVRPANVFAARSQIATAQTTTISGSNVAAGDTTLNVASTTSWAAGDIGVVAGGTSGREELFRVARVTDSTHLLLDSPCQYAHTTAQADALFNKSDVWTVDLPGGWTYEVIADYGDDAAGGTRRAHAIVNSLAIT